MAKASGGADPITYVDMGDHWIEIDNRGEVERRTTLPKSTRDIGVSQQMRTELEGRIESEVPEADREDALANLPPVETEEDAAAREKKAAEALAPAKEEAPAAPKATSSSSSSGG